MALRASGRLKVAVTIGPSRATSTSAAESVLSTVAFVIENARAMVSPPKTAPGAFTKGALEGLRVIDQTQVMAGPFCSMLLADLGADVIKVEPREGEHTRQERQIAPGVSGSFLAVNRNKRGMALDLKSPSGVEILKRLAATADVLVENYRPGVAQRLGIDYDALKQINPRLIYCSISGFG